MGGADTATPGQYEVHLDVFQGPFDLLLQLIAKRKLDITEVDLADITQDFLASLQGIDELDLETATRFLVVAATLVELKAARLLPRDQQEELEDLLGEARDMLYARLLEYRAFRDVAWELQVRLEVHGDHHGRDVPLDPVWRRLVPDADLHVGIEDLARLAALATAPRPEPEIRIDHIRRSFISIQDAAGRVLDAVMDPGDTTGFVSLVTGQRRGDAIVFFLAMLELYKLGHLDLEQPDHRGELTVERREAATDLSVLSELETSGAPDEDLPIDPAPTDHRPDRPHHRGVPVSDTGTDAGIDLDRLRGLEAVLFLADHPLDLDTLATALDCTPGQVEPLTAELAQRLEERQSGLVLRNVGGGWRLYTAAETREHVERHVLAGRSGRLSQAALETLAVIAYKQPISRTEVGDIRGVNADGAVRSLVSRGLIEEVGRDDGPGQAVLYGTTTEFLEKVGLTALDDLPPLTEYLVENPAPDEPTPDQLKAARRRLQEGREIASTGSARWDPEAEPSDEDPAEQARERQRELRRDAAARRRAQEEEMDELTGALERVARDAMAQLRDAVSSADDDESDAEPAAAPDEPAATSDEDTAGPDQEPT